MKVGYARVSSNSQDLTIQQDKLKDSGCDKLFTEKLSGKTTDGRKSLQQVLDFVREGDSVVVTRLDRLARSVIDLGNIAKTLESKKVDLVVLDQQIDTSTASGKLMFNMIGAFAEFERDLINERCAEGREKAKANGVQFGRKSKLSNKELKNLRDEYKTWSGSKVELAAKYEISRASLYRLVS